MDPVGRAKKAYDEAIDALESGDVERALSRARVALKHDYSGGYEAMARAHYEKGDEEEAIETLEEGVERFPGVYPLWSYLGEYYSNAGRYEDALAAFRRSGSAGNDEQNVVYNVALIYGRMGDFGQALREIERASGGAVPEHLVLEAKAFFLNRLDRFDEALECAERAAQAEGTSRAHSSAAVALYGLGRHNEALSRARECLASDLTSGDALEVVRRFGPAPSASSKLYCVMYEGKTHLQLEDGEAINGCFGTFWAIADSPEEALTFYSAIDGETFNLHVRRSSVEDSPIEGNKGVTAVRGGRTFFIERPSFFKRLARSVFKGSSKNSEAE